MPVTSTAPFLSIGFTVPELCTRCGSCRGVCPAAAIEWTEQQFPRLLSDRCTACGLCGKVCPGAAVSFGALAQQVFGESIADTTFDGFVKTVYVGYAADPQLRNGGAGGGVVTALLAHLLHSGRVEGCLVTRMNKHRPWEGEPFVARSYEDLCQSQGSRYHVIPMNSLWSDIRRQGGKYAAALLPCQTHGYRALQKTDPALARHIEPIIGLFCGGSLEPYLTTELLALRGIRPGDIADFQFRGGEWPGQMRAVLKNGSIRPLHYSNYKDGAYNYCTSLYMPERCQTCLDGSNEFSDVSVSDAWTRDKKGEYKFKAQSRLLVRTQRGEALVREAVQAGVLVLSDVSADPHYRTHAMQTRRKGSLAPLRVARWGKSGRRVPRYDRTASETARWKERVTERASSALIRAGKCKFFRMATLGFLTSRWAIPLINLRIYLKKRKYKRRA